MVKRSRKRKKRDAPKGSTRAKGDVLEQIVASMHDTPNVRVEQNVFLCTQDGSGRAREIDVLVFSQVAGYPIHIAIECKNEKNPTGVGQIDEFIGKLQDVGIPTQLGIFVSAGGYTSGATLRAQEAGITPLVLRDVTDHLPQSVQHAVQSIIWLLLTITNIQVQNDVPGPAPAGEILFFRNRDGQVCGSIPDLVWLKWRSGEISAELGSHSIELDPPEDWLQIVNKQIAQVSRIAVDVQVTGHVVTFSGSVRQLELARATDMGMEKWQVEAKFDEPHGTYPVVTFSTEEDLQSSISEAGDIRLTVGRFRLPRIRWLAMYWPPSENTMRKLLEFVQQSNERGEKLDLASLDLTEFEGTDMRKAWEPIIADHPLAGSFLAKVLTTHPPGG